MAVSLLYKWSHRGVKTIAQGRQLGNRRPCLSGYISYCSHCHHKALDKATQRKKSSFWLTAAVYLTGKSLRKSEAHEGSKAGASAGTVPLVHSRTQPTWWHHPQSGWSSLQNTSQMPRVCSHGDSKAHQMTPLYQPSVFPGFINLTRDFCIPKYKEQGRGWVKNQRRLGEFICINKFRILNFRAKPLKKETISDWTLIPQIVWACKHFKRRHIPALQIFCKF